VVAEIERATGGRADIHRLSFDARTWRARLDGLTIHGTEQSAEKPLLQAEAVEVELRVVSFLRRRVDVAGVRVVRPEVRVLVAPDGSTNLPSPKQKRNRPLMDEILDLAVGEFQIERGELWLNQQRYALDFAVAALRAQVRLVDRDRYQGEFEAGRVTISSQPRLPPVEQARLRFDLLRDRIEIHELYARSAGSEIKAAGTVEDPVKPRWRFRYQAAADARELAAAIPAPELRAGRLEAQGTLEAAAGEWKTQGKLSTGELSVVAREFRLGDVSAAGQYFADPRQVRVEEITARVLGGLWSGRLAAAYPPEARITLDGRLEGIRLEAVLAAAAAPRRPLTGPGYSGLISGTLSAQLTWPFSRRRMTADADLTIVPAGGPSPLEGRLLASYRGPKGELRLEEARLATSATQLSAFGRLTDAGDASIQFRLRTSRLEELSAASQAVTGARPEIPMRLDGSAAAQGRLTGSVEQPELTAAVDVTRFAQDGREWDSLNGRLEWSRRRARLTGGRLVKGNAVVSLNAVAQLDDGRFTDRSSFEAEVGVRETPLDALMSLAGQKLPISGLVTASMKLKGTQEDLRGAGSVELRRVVAWGEPVDSVRAGLALEDGEIRAHGLRVAKGRGAVTGAAAWHRERRIFRLDLRGENLSLADQRWLARTGWRLSGDGGFTWAGSGRLQEDSSLDKLIGEGVLELRSLAVDGRRMGNLSARFRSAAEKILLEAQSDLLGAAITGAGQIETSERFPIQARLEVRNLDLGRAAQAAGLADAGAPAGADGYVEIQGEITRPEDITWKGTVTRLEAGWPQVAGAAGRPPALRNAGPVVWRIANRRCTFEPFRLEGEGTSLTASGVIDLAAGGGLKLAVHGGLNLAVLAAFHPDLKTSGNSALNIDVAGTREKPVLGGKLELRDGSFAWSDFPLGLSDASGVVTFSQGRATIQKLLAKAGGGEVSFSGDADFSAGAVHYRLRSEARRVRVRFPQGLTTVVDGELALVGSNRRSRMEGEIQIVRLGTRGAVDLPTILEALKQPARTPSASDWLQATQLDVRIVSAPEARFETSLARNLQAEVNLHLYGNVLNPALLGRINIAQGELEYQGSRYRISRGDIFFTNPFRIEPVLNMDLETRVAVYDITLTLIGPMHKLNVTYRSDPPLTFNEVLQLLAVGRAPTQDPTLAAQQTQVVADAVIGQAISRPLTGRLQRFFGVSRIKVDPENFGSEGSPNARITLEQHVGNDITFTYTYNVASAQEQIIRIRWAVNREWSIEAVRDQNGLFGIDVLYRRRFR